MLITRVTEQIWQHMPQVHQQCVSYETSETMLHQYAIRPQVRR